MDVNQFCRSVELFRDKRLHTFLQDALLLVLLARVGREPLGDHGDGGRRGRATPPPGQSEGAAVATTEQPQWRHVPGCVPDTRANPEKPGLASSTLHT